MRTKDRLVAALDEARAPRGMIDLARQGEYDDFESTSATPITDLVAHARANGLERIATRAIAGEFDGSAEEADAWLAANPDVSRELM